MRRGEPAPTCRDGPWPGIAAGEVDRREAENLAVLHMHEAGATVGHAGEAHQVACGIDAPLQAELVAAASKESEKLDELMADLIEVAELDTGKRELKLEAIRPLQALSNARDRYCDEAGRKRIRVELRAYADLSTVKADRRALRSILDNLLANALRYTPDEGEILLAAEEVKDRVQFTVRDTGRGIEAERLSTIFDRFNPMSESGSGLGLALVRRLVEQLGGQIAVESRLGHGTTFRFTLPVAAVLATRHPVEVG